MEERERRKKRKRERKHEQDRKVRERKKGRKEGRKKEKRRKPIRKTNKPTQISEKPVCQGHRLPLQSPAGWLLFKANPTGHKAFGDFGIWKPPPGQYL